MKTIIIFFLMLGVCLIQGCRTKEDLFTAGDTNAAIQESTDEAQFATEVSSRENRNVCVYVCGYVYRPGVYSLEEGSRICDALDLAGGVTEDGKPEALNQAEYINDGQTIYVPGVGDDINMEKVDDGLVDINQADKTTLMTLPGIGESKADLIIQYRQEHGAFESIEDLMDIPGIKEGVFNKIKDSIKVS